MVDLALLFLVQSIHVIPVMTISATRLPRMPPTTAPMLVPLELGEGLAAGAETTPQAGTVQFVISGLFKTLH